MNSLIDEFIISVPGHAGTPHIASVLAQEAWEKAERETARSANLVMFQRQNPNTDYELVEVRSLRAQKVWCLNFTFQVHSRAGIAP